MSTDVVQTSRLLTGIIPQSMVSYKNNDRITQRPYIHLDDHYENGQPRRHHATIIFFVETRRGFNGKFQSFTAWDPTKTLTWEQLVAKAIQVAHDYELPKLRTGHYVGPYIYHVSVGIQPKWKLSG